jgi:hypothetical protein
MPKKLFNVSDGVLERLEAEDNQSALVDVLLHNHYGLPIETEGWHNEVRARVADSLGDTPVAYEETTETTVPDQLVEPELPTVIEEQLNEQEDRPVIEDAPAPTDPEPTEPSETADETGRLNGDVSTDQGTSEQPSTEVQVETPEDQPNGQVEAEVPIKVNGQPGGNCDKHGPYIGEFCPECLLDSL